MTDHTENSLRAVVTSLRTIVAPAVDPADPLAQQQLQLSIAYLEFLGARLPHLADRDRFEVTQNARLADAVAAVAGPGAAELTGAATHARTVERDPDASRDELRAAAAVLAALISELIESDLDDATRRAVEVAVVEHSAERVELDRAWYAPMGFDPDPASVVPVADVLSRAR